MTDYLMQRIIDAEDATGHNKDVKTFFIAFSGKKQVGKDTAADMAKELMEKKGLKVGVTAFAEVLKDIAINVIGIPRNMIYGSDEEKEQLTHVIWDNMSTAIRFKYSNEHHVGGIMDAEPLPRTGNMTSREFMQVLGTDIFREMFSVDVWARSPFRRNWSEYDAVLIVDCRFPNEKLVTEQHKGAVIRITRNTGRNDDHPSETALDGVEFTHSYSNEGSLEDLNSFVKETLTKLKLI